LRPNTSPRKGKTQGRTLLLVSFSALLVSSPAASTASVMLSQGLMPPASRASRRCRQRRPSRSTTRRPCASGTYGATRLGSPHPGPLLRPGALPRQSHGRHARARLCLHYQNTYLFPKTGRGTANSKDLRFCRLRGRFLSLGIWLVQLLPWLRFRVLHVDAEKNWA
jgi:hypothetical protein